MMRTRGFGEDALYKLSFYITFMYYRHIQSTMNLKLMFVTDTD